MHNTLHILCLKLGILLKFDRVKVGCGGKFKGFILKIRTKSVLNIKARLIDNVVKGSTGKVAKDSIFGASLVL